MRSQYQQGLHSELIELPDTSIPTASRRWFSQWSAVLLATVDLKIVIDKGHERSEYVGTQLRGASQCIVAHSANQHGDKRKTDRHSG